MPIPMEDEVLTVSDSIYTIAAIMNGKLPSRMHAAHLIQRRARIATCLFCHELPRLADLCLSSDSKIRVKLEFAPEPGSNRPFVIVATQATLALKCQRCLAPMERDILQHSRLIIAENEAEAKVIPFAHDIVICNEGYINLKDMVEDEILLALPDILVHENMGECDQQVAQYARVEKKRCDNPFSALKNL